LSESVFFPSLLLSAFNILKTVYAFYENRLLIRFVEEANSGKLAEQAAEDYINSGITSLNLVGADLGAEGARAVAIALKAKVFIYCTVPNFSHVCSGFIQDIGPISTVTVNTFPLPIQDIKSKAELDFSGKGLKVEDAIIIAALIPSNVSCTTCPHPCYH
jgi:hypothetical protein